MQQTRSDEKEAVRQAPSVFAENICPNYRTCDADNRHISDISGRSEYVVFVVRFDLYVHFSGRAFPRDRGQGYDKDAAQTEKAG